MFFSDSANDSSCSEKIFLKNLCSLKIMKSAQDILFSVASEFVELILNGNFNSVLFPSQSDSRPHIFFLRRCLIQDF